MAQPTQAAARTSTRTERSVSFVLDEDAHPLEAIYGASYPFIDRCYVCLTRTDPTHLQVTLAARGEIESPGVWDAVEREFRSELAAGTFRATLTDANQAILDSVLVQAVAGGADPLADAGDGDLDDMDDMDDPLGIAQSWEEKYGQKSDASGDSEDPA